MSPTAELDVPEIQDVQKSSGEKVQLKRLNLNLTLKAFEELQMLAQKSQRSMTELVRLGLGLVKIALEASSRNEKLAVVRNDGTPLREIVIP